jgi:hypothetical protein
LYAENIYLGPFNFGKGQNVWARQLNPEVDTTHVMNQGANVWILGLKTEERSTGCSTVLITEQGGQTELLGGCIVNWPEAYCGKEGGPVFINNASRESLVFTTVADATNGVILYQVEETLDGRLLAPGPPSYLYSFGRGAPAAYGKGPGNYMSRVPLFIGY